MRFSTLTDSIPYTEQAKEFLYEVDTPANRLKITSFYAALVQSFEELKSEPEYAKSTDSKATMDTILRINRKRNDIVQAMRIIESLGNSLQERII